MHLACLSTEKRYVPIIFCIFQVTAALSKKNQYVQLIFQLVKYQKSIEMLIYLVKLYVFPVHVFYE